MDVKTTEKPSSKNPPRSNGAVDGKEDKGKPQVAMADTGSGSAMATGSDRPAGDKPTGDKPVEGTGSAANTAAGSGSAVTPPPVEKAAAEKAPVEKASVEKTPAHANPTTAHPHSTGGSTPVAPKEKPVVAEKAPKVEKDTGAGGCDEVSCVLANYEGACCSKFKKGGGNHAASNSDPGASSKPKSDLPDALDRSMISSGVGNVKARVTSCGDKSSAKGKVKVHVKVGADGKVQNVAVEVTPDAALGACVAAAMQKASFSKTQSGGSFSYPFVF